MDETAEAFGHLSVDENKEVSVDRAHMYCSNPDDP